MQRMCSRVCKTVHAVWKKLLQQAPTWTRRKMRRLQVSYSQNTPRRHDRHCKADHGGSAKNDMIAIKSPEESVRPGRNNIVGRKLGGET